MNAGEIKLMRRRRRDGFFNTVGGDDLKFTVTTMHDLRFPKIKSFTVQSKTQKEKKALFITARLLNLENKRKKQTEKRTVGKLTNEHAWRTENSSSTKNLFFFFFG